MPVLSKVGFRWVFGAALVCYVVHAGVSDPLPFGEAMLYVALVLGVLGFWVSRWPRGAAIALTVLASWWLATAIRTLVVRPVWWRFALIPLDVAVVLAAAYSAHLARAGTEVGQDHGKV